MTRNPGANTPPTEPEELVARVGRQVRQMGAQSVMTSQAVAARFGLHTTDLECLDLIYMRERATPGELAQATGLTSGAMTALIDRLERAGYVQRVDDPDDRRRVQVRICREATAPIQSVYEPMQKRMLELWSSYSARDLAVILDFLRRSTDLAISCTEEVSRQAPTPHRRRPPRTSKRAAAKSNRSHMKD